MHTVINCRSFLKPSRTGIGRYAFHLVQELSQIDSANQYTLYSQRRLFDFKRQAPKINSNQFQTKFDFFNKGLAKTVGDFDIYHAPSIEDIADHDKKIIVTIHDLIYKTYPEGHTQETIETTERQIPVMS